MNDNEILKNIETKLSVIIALLAGFSEKNLEEGRKIDVVLSQAGLSNAEVAKLLGKKLAAVQKVIQRSRK